MRNRRDPTRSVLHVAKTRRNGPRRIAPRAHFERNDITIICETAPGPLRRNAVYTPAQRLQSKTTLSN